MTGGLRKEDKRLALGAGDETIKNKREQVLHDVKVAKFDPADRSQKWWHGKDGALHSFAPYHDFVLVERDNKVMMLDHEESFETHHGKYVANELIYDQKLKTWKNGKTDNHIIIDVSDPF